MKKTSIFILFALLALGQTAWAEQVSYIAEDGSTATCTNYTEITDLTDGPIGTTGETTFGFTSACDPKSLPYSYGFEDPDEFNCWTKLNCHDNSKISQNAAYEGQNGFDFYYSNKPPQYLISPQFEGNTGMSVSFYYKNTSDNYPETFQVGYSTTTESPNDFTWSEEVTANDQYTWKLYENYFPIGTKYVAVKLISDDMFHLYLDNFNFEPAFCANEDKCELTFELTDTYGDSWNGNAISVVDVLSNTILATLANEDLDGCSNVVETQTITLAVCHGRQLRFEWKSGEWPEECSYTVTDINGNEVFSGGGAMNEPVSFTPDCTPIFDFEGYWNDGNNWNIGVVPEEGSDVIIAANVTIPDGCLAQADSITVQNEATITIADGGQLLHTNAGVQATVQKSIAGHDPSNLSGWSFIASPIIASVNPSTIGLITDDFGNSISEGQTTTYDLYYYDEPNELWKNYRNEAFYLNNGQGYLYANNAGTSISFEGTLNASTADPTIAVTASDNNLTGFNLVGNPFARNLSMASLAMETNGDYSHITAIYEINNGEVIINENPSDIPPCGGFFIQTNAAGTLHFNHALPEGSNGHNRGDLRIEVSNAEATRGGATLLDRAYINFDEGNAIDKFTLNPDATKLYIPQGGKDFAIVVSEGHGEMPLNFRANEDGNYTISVNPEGVEMTYLHLIDNMTGADVDLLATKVPEPIEGPGVSTSSTTSYTFNAKTTDYESRFKLVFVANGEVGPSTGSGTFAFINATGNIIVDGEGTLQVIDILGRQISSQEIHSAFLIQHSTFAPGVYVFRLINGDDVRTQKIVIE